MADLTKQKAILAQIQRDRKAIAREIGAKLEADRKLEPQVREYEEILKIQKLMEELEGKSS